MIKWRDKNENPNKAFYGVHTIITIYRLFSEDNSKLRGLFIEGSSKLPLRQYSKDVIMA